MTDEDHAPPLPPSPPPSLLSPGKREYEEEEIAPQLLLATANALEEDLSPTAVMPDSADPRPLRARSPFPQRSVYRPPPPPGAAVAPLCGRE